MDPKESLFGHWESILGVYESILCSKSHYAPMSIVSNLLEVYLGSLEDNFLSVEGEFGLWHSNLRPLELFKLPKNRVVPQRRGSLEHSTRGPFGFRALFYLVIAYFSKFLLPRDPLHLLRGLWMGGWAYFMFAYICGRNLSQNGLFSRMEQKISYISNFDLCESNFGFGESISGLWEFILTVRVSFVPRRVDFEQLAFDLNPPVS